MQPPYRVEETVLELHLPNPINIFLETGATTCVHVQTVQTSQVKPIKIKKKKTQLWELRDYGLNTNIRKEVRNHVKEKVVVGRQTYLPQYVS